MDFPTLHARHLRRAEHCLGVLPAKPVKEEHVALLMDHPIPPCPIFLPWWLSIISAGVIPKVRSMSVQTFTSGSWQSFCFLTAETEKGSADHLDLAGLPPRPKEADGLQMTPPSPDSRKKARGIKKLFGRWVKDERWPFSRCGAWAGVCSPSSVWLHGFYPKSRSPCGVWEREQQAGGRQKRGYKPWGRSCLCWLSWQQQPNVNVLSSFRLKRSQSTTFNPDDMSEPEFKRGGTRATAGPRLGWSRDLGQSHK